MRRKSPGAKRWLEYTKPVCIHEDSTPLEGLHVTCYFYKRVQGPNNEDRYRLDHADWSEYPITCVSCPVALTYTESKNRGRSYYTLAPETRQILQAQKRGSTTFDYSAENNNE